MESLLASLGLSLAGYLAISLAVFAGAFVQGAIGFGLNLIAVPVIAIYQPAVLPAAAIIFALPMTVGSALRERAHIDRPAILWTTLGRLPGVVLGAWLVSLLSPRALALLIGGFVVVAVAMSVVSVSVPITRATQAGAGFLGGLMGTSSSIGGPPMALLYQRSPGPTMRSTLGAAFLVGTALSLGALALAGQVSAIHWRFGVAMVPPVLIGLVASGTMHARLDAGWLRPCVLGFSALAGAVVVVRGLLSL